MELTQDIKEGWRNWLNLARRLQAEGCKQEGIAIAKLYVVLNSKGEPLHWTSPKITLLEPKRKITEKEILLLIDLFGDEFISSVTGGY